MPNRADTGRVDLIASDDDTFIPSPTPKAPATATDERLSAALFTGVNVAVFMILVCCVFAATLMYDRWH